MTKNIEFTRKAASETIQAIQDGLGLLSTLEGYIKEYRNILRAQVLNSGALLLEVSTSDDHNWLYKDLLQYNWSFEGSFNAGRGNQWYSYKNVDYPELEIIVDVNKNTGR